MIRQLRAAQTVLAALTALAMLLFGALLFTAPRARAEGTVAKGGPHHHAAIRARRVPITFLSPAAAKAEQGSRHPGHAIRYIAGGVLIAVVAIVGGILYFNRRREAALN